MTRTAVDWLVAAGGETSGMTAYLESGERVNGWRWVPTFSTWAIAMSAWLLVTGGAAWAATARHRES